MIKNYYCYHFLVIFFLGIFIVPFSAKASLVGAANQATLSVYPASGSYKPNDTFTISVMMNTNGQSVVVSAAYLNYDKNSFQVESINTTDSVFTSEAEKIIDSSSGVVKITRGIPTPGVNTASGLVAKINFKALNATVPSADNLNFSFIAGDNTLSTVIKNDGLGTNILSGVYGGRYTISGVAATDTTSPTLSNILISNITKDSATILWTSDESATSQVQYGLTDSYGQSTTKDANLSISHSVNLSGLSSSTTYHFKVISLDEAGNQASSVDQTFVTISSIVADSISPSSVADLAFSNITQTSINLLWTSPGDDNNVGTAAIYDIRYSLNAITESNWTSASQISGEPMPLISGSSQSVVVVGLTPDTTYYFAMKTSDEAPNISTISNIVTTKTLSVSTTNTPIVNNGGGVGGGTYSDSTPPSQPANFEAVPSDKQIVLSWNNPADYDFVRVVIIRSVEPIDDESPNAILEKGGIVIYEGSGHSFTDTSLENSRIYYYHVFSYDAKPNYSKKVSVSASPKANTSTDVNQHSYPDSTLVKLDNSPKVYVIINQKKKWIPTPEVFETLGYKWKSITIIDSNTLKSIPDFEDNLIRAVNDYKVYIIVNGIRRHIPNPEIFLDYGFNWSDVRDVPEATISKYKRAYLIRESRRGDVYYLSSNNIKKHIPSSEIFSSYNDKWEDIQVVSKKEMESYKTSNLIKLYNGSRIYLIENNVKRWIPDIQTFNKRNYEWGNILSVNQIEFDWYKNGNAVK